MDCCDLLLPRTDPDSLTTALLLMRAAGIGMMCGFFIPPIRPSMLTTMQVPPVSAIAAARIEREGRQCRDEDCRRQGCRGNRLAKVVIDGQPHLQFHIPHHKTESSKAATQHEIETSVGDASLLYTVLILLLKGGWQKVADQADKRLKKHRNPSKVARTLLLWPSGRPVIAGDLAKWWHAVGIVGCKPGSVPHNPRDCRHMFATAVRDLRLANREEEGLTASIMGNSSHAWDRRYDHNKDNRATGQVAEVCNRLMVALAAKLATSKK